MSLIPYLYNFNVPRRMMEWEFSRPNSFSDLSPFNELVPRDFFSPWCSDRRENVFNPWCSDRRENVFNPPLDQVCNIMNRLALNEAGNIISDKEKFQVNVDVQHFAPEEINVKVVDGHVVVQGKHEEKQDEHGYVSREFVRRYALPKECLPDTVESKLSSDGVLTITAPKVLPLPSTGERIVPITHTGPVQKKQKVPESN